MATETEYLKLFKYHPETDSENVFSIHQALNMNWDKIYAAVENMSSRKIGEIITSTIPLTDAGIHLLDGALIQGNGIYKDFVDYMANVYKTKDRTYNPSIFTIVGSPTITKDGIASGFSSSNYLKIDSISWGNSYIIEGEANIDGDGCFLSLVSGTYDLSFSNSTSENKIKIWNNINFSSQNISYSSYGTLSHIKYQLVVNITNNQYYITYELNKSGVTQTLDLTSNAQTILNSVDYITLGNSGKHWTSQWALTGSIDLKQFSITVDGVEVLSGSTPGNYFTDETTWQNTISQYGVCGKFVYDNTNNTVRLPKITGIIEGTTDITALGDLNETYVKLPNITGWFQYVQNVTSNYSSDGAFYNGTRVSLPDANAGTTSGQQFCLDASRCSDVYSGDGTDTVVHPQTIELLLYIVIAETANTQIQVDINQVATDLNGKVNITDCQEVQCVVETYSNGTSWYRIYSDGWCEQGGYSSGAIGTDASRTIYLLRNYKDTNYNVFQQSYGSTSGAEGTDVMVYSKATDTFILCNEGYVATMYGLNWKTEGYIEV